MFQGKGRRRRETYEEENGITKEGGTGQEDAGTRVMENTKEEGKWSKMRKKGIEVGERKPEKA